MSLTSYWVMENSFTVGDNKEYYLAREREENFLQRI